MWPTRLVIYRLMDIGGFNLKGWQVHDLSWPHAGLGVRFRHQIARFTPEHYRREVLKLCIYSFLFDREIRFVLVWWVVLFLGKTVSYLGKAFFLGEFLQPQVQAFFVFFWYLHHIFLEYLANAIQKQLAPKMISLFWSRTC